MKEYKGIATLYSLDTIIIPCEKDINEPSFISINERLNRLTDILYRIRLLLERHEGHKYNDDWKQEYYVNKPSYLSA